MSIKAFRDLYERHIKCVAASDLKAVLADIAPETMPAIFEGVTSPRDDVEGFEIKDVRVEDDRGIGETVYRTTRGDIGLRSIWEQRAGSWKAVALENFAVS